jgi:hypothetical protein
MKHVGPTSIIDVNLGVLEQRILSEILYPEPDWIKEERQGIQDQIMAEMLGWA